jgi:hypothetical protein
MIIEARRKRELTITNTWNNAEYLETDKAIKKRGISIASAA